MKIMNQAKYYTLDFQHVECYAQGPVSASRGLVNTALWWPTYGIESPPLPSELTVLPKREQRPLLVLHQFGCQLDCQPDEQHPQRGIQQEVHQVPAERVGQGEGQGETKGGG